MFGCQPTFPFRKLQEYRVYFHVVENYVSVFNTTTVQLVRGREADQQMSKDLRNRQWGEKGLAPWEVLYNSKVGGHNENRSCRENEKKRHC